MFHSSLQAECLFSDLLKFGRMPLNKPLPTRSRTGSTVGMVYYSYGWQGTVFINLHIYSFKKMDCLLPQ